MRYCNPMHLVISFATCLQCWPRVSSDAYRLLVWLQNCVRPGGITTTTTVIIRRPLQNKQLNPRHVTNVRQWTLTSSVSPTRVRWTSSSASRTNYLIVIVCLLFVYLFVQQRNNLYNREQDSEEENVLTASVHINSSKLKTIISEYDKGNN